MALSVHLPHRTVCSWWGLCLASHYILKHLSYSRLSLNTWWIVTDFKREVINTMPAFAHCGLKRITWTRNWVAYFNQGAKQFGLFLKNFHKTKCACIRHFLFQERIRPCICSLLCIPATNHLHLDPQLLCPFWLWNPLLDYLPLKNELWKRRQIANAYLFLPFLAQQQKPSLTYGGVV